MKVSFRLEWFVYISREIYGPFSKSEAVKFAEKHKGLLLGPCLPKQKEKKQVGETPRTPEMIQHMLDELKAPKKQLTQWELDFLSSITSQFEQRGSLSVKQFTKLESIYAEKSA